MSEINRDLLAIAIQNIDMGLYWRDEMRQVNDPPGMRRIRFEHRDYARAIADAYERLAAYKAEEERHIMTPRSTLAEVDGG